MVSHDQRFPCRSAQAAGPCTFRFVGNLRSSSTEPRRSDMFQFNLCPYLC